MGERVARKRQATTPEVAEEMRGQGVVGDHGTGPPSPLLWIPKTERISYATTVAGATADAAASGFGRKSAASFSSTSTKATSSACFSRFSSSTVRRFEDVTSTTPPDGESATFPRTRGWRSKPASIPARACWLSGDSDRDESESPATHPPERVAAAELR